MSKRRICDLAAQMGGKTTEMSDSGGVNKGVEVSEGLVASCFHSPGNWIMVRGVGCVANTLRLIYTPEAKIHT